VSDAAKSDALLIKPRIARWNPKEHEKLAFEQRESIPGWRLADKSRRMLGDTTNQLSESLPAIAASEASELQPWANRFAAVEAAGIAIRTGGAVLAQVSCGYVIEAAAALRRIIEARLNLSAFLADPSGTYALKFIEGRPSRLSTLAKRHGSRQEIDALSQLNHADSRTLDLFWDPTMSRQEGAITYGKFHVFPQVVEEKALSLLYVVSKEFVGVAETVCEVFGAEIEVTPWVRQELLRLDELAAQEAADRSSVKELS
jgi:hypothetical protein